MAKFLAELLGCTLPDKGAPPLFECRSQPHLGLRPSSKQRPTIFGTFTNERALFDNRPSKEKLFICGLGGKPHVFCDIKDIISVQQPCGSAPGRSCHISSRRDRSKGLDVLAES